MAVLFWKRNLLFWLLILVSRLSKQHSVEIPSQAWALGRLNSDFFSWNCSHPIFPMSEKNGCKTESHLGFQSIAAPGEAVNFDLNIVISRKLCWNFRKVVLINEYFPSLWAKTKSYSLPTKYSTNLGLKSTDNLKSVLQVPSLHFFLYLCPHTELPAAQVAFVHLF